MLVVPPVGVRLDPCRGGRPEALGVMVGVDGGEVVVVVGELLQRHRAGGR